MAVRAFRSFSALALLLLAAHGCGDDRADEDAGSKPKVCTPGTVYECFRAGCKGRQSCSSDGTSLSRCTCPSPSEEDAGQLPDAGGKRDAAVEECAGELTCQRAAAAGWSGPIALREADDCTGAYGKRVFRAGAEPSAAAASCSTCTCDAASSCAPFVDFTTGSEAGCGGTSCTTSVNQSCSEIMPPCLAGSSTAYLGTKLASGGGTCTPSEQKAELPEVKWARRAVGCQAEERDASCASGDVCLPKLASGAKSCVYREGEHDCPSRGYTERQLLYRDVEDTRACSACSCGAASCSYSWSVFNAGDTSCASPIIKLTSAGQCVQVNPSADKLRVGATIEGDGACDASGGTSSGGVSGKDALTVCCET
ncbi:MAG TPA: hypothetical protein VJR89_08835 [Polyangiales bacterium]|nr:hypothetical protein [Polyangiales bacterium]